MERSNVYVVTEQLEAKFRSSIEGCIPDLMDGDRMEGSMNDMLDYEPTEPDAAMHDNIYDFAADRAYDTFPNVPDEERTAMAKRIATYFCGSQPSTDEKFKVAALRHDTSAVAQVAVHLGESDD